MKGLALLRFGNVCDVDASRGYVRVEFDEDGITSHWLPLVKSSARADKFYSMPAINEQVACIMDENCEEGAVIGALYSAVDMPTGFGAGKSGVIFEDGSKVTYDKATKQIYVYSEGKVVIEGNVLVSIKTNAESLKAILSDLIDAILLETHPTGTGPSGTPLNFAQYQAIKTRISLLLE